MPRHGRRCTQWGGLVCHPAARVSQHAPVARSIDKLYRKHCPAAAFSACCRACTCIWHAADHACMHVRL